MTHVDALSRQIFVVQNNSFDRNLALCQSDDPIIAKIQAELQRSENKLFEMRNGLVYKKRQGQILFYVLSALESNIIYKYHNQMSHVGIEKTVRNILNSYWFSEMKAKVERHIRNCLKCIAFTPSSGKSEEFLPNLPKGDKSFTTLHIDHLDHPMQTSTSLEFENYRNLNLSEAEFVAADGIEELEENNKNEEEDSCTSEKTKL